MGGPKNYPLAECKDAITDLWRRIPDATFYQKWTCSCCGNRITANTPNVLFEHGHCEDCGYTTDLRKTGCNYLISYPTGTWR